MKKLIIYLVIALCLVSFVSAFECGTVIWNETFDNSDNWNLTGCTVSGGHLRCTALQKAFFIHNISTSYLNNNITIIFYNWTMSAPNGYFIFFANRENGSDYTDNLWYLGGDGTGMETKGFTPEVTITTDTGVPHDIIVKAYINDSYCFWTDGVYKGCGKEASANEFNTALFSLDEVFPVSTLSGFAVCNETIQDITIPPLISDAICTSCTTGTNNTVDSTPTINVTCTDYPGCAMVRIANDSSYNFSTATALRDCTVGSGNTFVCTLPSSDKLTNVDVPQPIYFWANDTLGNYHNIWNLTINVTLIVPTEIACKNFSFYNRSTDDSTDILPLMSIDCNGDVRVLGTYYGEWNYSINYALTTDIQSWISTNESDDLTNNSDINVLKVNMSEACINSSCIDDWSDVNISGAGASVGNTKTMVFDQTNCPTTWSALDLSGIVGGNAALVHLAFNASGGDMNAVAVRATGDTTDYHEMTSEVSTYGIAVAHHDSAGVPGGTFVLSTFTDNAGSIDWICETQQTADVNLLGWIS